MIIYKCDICKKRIKDGKFETLVLYTKKIDYCKSCSKEATRIKKAIERSIKFYNNEKTKNIIKAENNILKQMEIR